MCRQELQSEGALLRVARAERLFKENLISEVQTDWIGTEATQAARGQRVSILSLPAEGRMEPELSTAGRLHRCRNSDMKGAFKLTSP